MALLEELMQAALTAPDERKRAAVELLRGLHPVTAPAPRGPLLLGMTAAARYLGVSRATLWRMVRAGQFQRIELFPGCFRLRRADLEAVTQSIPEVPPASVVSGGAHQAGRLFPPCGGTAEPTRSMEKLP